MKMPNLRAVLDSLVVERDRLNAAIAALQPMLPAEDAPVVTKRKRSAAAIRKQVATRAANKLKKANGADGQPTSAQP
jgi:hypothetical protein